MMCLWHKQDHSSKTCLLLTENFPKQKTEPEMKNAILQYLEKWHQSLANPQEAPVWLYNWQL